MTDSDRLTLALDEFGDKPTDAHAVLHLGRVQPEPFKSQMASVARDLDEGQRLALAAAAALRDAERPDWRDACLTARAERDAALARADVLDAAIRTHRSSLNPVDGLTHRPTDVRLWALLDTEGDAT